MDASRSRTRLATGVQSPASPRFPDGAAMRSLGLFVSDDWLSGQRLDINYGLRYSRFRIETPDARLTPDDLTGNVGLSIDLGDDWHLVGNLGRGFRAPNIFDLGGVGRRPGNRYNIANPALEPEQVTSLDAGVKVGGERLTGELIAFRAQYRDKITSVLTGDVRPDGALVVQSRNVTELALSGVEAGLRYALTEPLAVQLSATYTRGEERLAAAEYPADRIPPLFGKAGLSYRARSGLSWDAYALYARAQRRLSPRDGVDPRINPEGTAGWATLNARVAWSVADRWELALRVENLGDKRYREHGSGLDEPGRNLIFTGDLLF